MNSMKFLTKLTYLIIGILVLLQTCSNAQNSPQDYVDAHNQARAADGVGNIAWNETVAAYAENYANQRAADCALIHSDTNGLYGENIGVGPELTGIGAVEMWVKEKANYDYDSNTCADNEMCGHYTQVVWSNSLGLGCARVQCNNGNFFVTCNYSPPGNYIGEKPF
ncbi:unnamed protein product [Amaranthus hypochondriacus]